MNEDLLDADQNSVMHDGLPDLNNYLFIHSSLDDAGLDPYEFRIFCHLRRRARDRVAFPGMRSISEATGISLGRVCATIRSLQAKGFLTVHKRPNQSNLYFVMAPKERERSPGEQGVHVVNGGVHVVNRCVHQVNERYSNEGTPIKEKPPTPLKGADRFFATAKKSKARITAESVLDAVKPDLTLQNLEFQLKWPQWVKSRLELPSRPTLSAFELHMKTCQRLGSALACKAIDYSIANGYRAIFPEPTRIAKNGINGIPKKKGRF